MAQRLHRKDLEAQAWCYLGDARLSRGDARGEADLRRAISVAESDSRDETRVRSLVNAAHGAYRSGHLDEAERFVAAGLQASADWEFFAGQYRLRLTAASVHASRGEWDRAVGVLRTLVDSALRAGDLSLARVLIAERLSLRESSVYAWNQRARWLRAMDETAAADQAAARAGALQARFAAATAA